MGNRADRPFFAVFAVVGHFGKLTSGAFELERIRRGSVAFSLPWRADSAFACRSVVASFVQGARGRSCSRWIDGCPISLGIVGRFSVY